jgi:N-methylhydantoinase B/oxoprolinase/acetone carboxylase alpha subunit
VTRAGLKGNAIELELFRQLLGSIAEEMGIVLRKTAYSANIKERRDYSCAVYDKNGQTVAMGEHMPVHLGAMPLSVRHAIDACRLGPGDVAVLNDPFAGGTHLPDITAVSAVFLPRERKPAFYVANRAHHADVGGMSPGSMPLAREIYQEGLRLPPVVLVKRGSVDEELMRVVLANVRTPEERRGDLMAQVMAIHRGAVRLHEIVRHYGRPAVDRNMRQLQDYSERMMRAAIARIPRGRYAFEDFLDGDGISDNPVRIAVTVSVQGDTATVDFTGSDPQAAGPVNANYAIVVAATAYVFRCLLSEEVPFTAGLLRPIGIIATPGTVANARPPAAMAAGNVETSQRITDVLLGALSKALPERIPAASSGTMSNVSFGGWDSVRGRAFTYYETIAGGMGAGPQHSGLSGVHTHMTNSWNTPVEALEHEFPIRLKEYKLRPDSGGRGARRGGDGIVRAYEFLAAAKATILADRRRTGPYGLGGGSAGATGRTRHVSGRSVREVPGKVEVDLGVGDILEVESPGGGGHGSLTGVRT